MRTFYLIFLLFGIPALAYAGPFTSHDDMVHDLAHFGAGTLVAEALHPILLRSTLKPWQIVITEVAAAGALTVSYEILTDKDFDVATERTLSGVSGGLAFSLSVQF